MENEYKQSKESDEKKVGKAPKTFKQSEKDEDKKVEKDKEKDIILMFRFNRAYELKIGKEYHKFEGREKRILPKSILEHKDFTPKVKEKFVIMEDKV